jgi:organic radical activating enzyme
MAIEVRDLYLTIQGEGPFSGQPAVFVRLAGCNLQCPHCDTDYTSDRLVYTPEALVAGVKLLAKTTNLVVITGGEPFRQVLGPLIKMLLDWNMRVQIETNGTLFDDSITSVGLHSGLTIVCSPKTAVNPKLQPYIHVLKYIIDSRYVAPDGLPTAALGMSALPERPWSTFADDGGKVYLQPCELEGDTKQTHKNILAAVDLCLKFGYYLSLQVHKIVGIP